MPLLLVLTAIYFWPQVGQGRALYWGDIGLYFTPMTQLLRDGLRAGRLPLWDPLLLCGAPYVGNPQTWPLYPLSVLLPAVPTPYFLSLTVAVHVWLAGLGTFLFLRRTLGVGVAGALLGAVTFMFGGWLVSKEQFPNMVQAAAYLPWVLWGLDRLLQRRRVSDALTFGLLLGLQLLAAHAQMTLLTLYLAAAWGVFRMTHLLAPPRSSAPQGPPAAGGHREAGRWVLPRRVVGLLALAGLVAAGLSAGQVLPTVQLFHDGWRQNLAFPIVDRFYLPLNQSANWVLPFLHGSPFLGNFTARGNFWETCCYVGWLPFVAATAGAWLAWRRGGPPEALFWAGVFVVGYAMALGGGAGHRHGLYWLAYKILPGFHSFHDPARCLVWAAFALAALAARGADALLARLPRRLPAAAVVLLVAFADLTWFGRTLYPLADPAMLFPVTRTVTAVRADPAFQGHQARFLAPDSARVWQRFSSHRAFRQGAPDYQWLWADTLTPNLPMAYGLPDAYGYEPVTRRDSQEVLGAVNGAFRPDAPVVERARAAARAGVIGVRAVVTDRVRPPEAALPGLTPRFSDPTLSSLYDRRDASRTIYSENTRWQPRARLVTDFVSVPDQEVALKRVTGALQHPDTDSLDLGRTIVVAGPVPFDPLASPATPATIVEDTPDRVTVAANTARPGLLILADTRDPGWRVTVDGRPAPLLSADACLRAVALPLPGLHRVVFVYRPTTFLLGLYLTLLTAGSLVGAGVFRQARKRGKESTPVLANSPH